LQEILECCTNNLEPKVDVKTIFIRLMDRLAAFALESETTVANLN